MTKNIRTQLNKVVGKSLDAYHKRMKPAVDELKFKEQYQGRIIDCMVVEVDDNYIETPETDAPIVKLEHSKEGVVKIPSIKGKTILVDADGNETDTPAEGCRLVSVGEEDNKLIILSKNKNLIDKNLIFDMNKSVDNNGEEVFAQNNALSNKFIKVKGNGIYFYSNSIDTNGVRIVQYDKNFNYLYQDYTRQRYIEMLSETRYIKFQLYTPHISVENFLTYGQIEENRVATEYIEPKHHKTENLLQEPLRKLPNGVCDEIVGNKIIRRVGKFILNGNNRWGEMTNNRFILIDKNIKPNIGDGKLITCICNMYESVGRGTLDNYSKNGIGTTYTGGIMIVDKNVQSLSDFKEKMNKNPIIVFCELAEPIIEELPNSITLQGFDDTTMYIENSITPTVQYGYNALIPYKEELSQQKEEVEVNTLDIENNIIPYLMDMEFNLMLM